MYVRAISFAFGLMKKIKAKHTNKQKQSRNQVHCLEFENRIKVAQRCTILEQYLFLYMVKMNNLDIYRTNFEIYDFMQNFSHQNEN